MLQRILPKIKTVGREQLTLLERLAPSIFVENTLRVNRLSYSSEAVRAETQSDLQISQRAAEKIREISADAGKEQILRIMVEGGGCSGFQYKFSLEDTVDFNDDAVIDQSGARVVVDDISLGLIRGSKIDYEEEMIRSSFVIVENPNSTAACGCGSSFNVKL